MGIETFFLKKSFSPKGRMSFISFLITLQMYFFWIVAIKNALVNK